MNSQKTDMLCWKCYDFKIIFTEILSVISELKAKSMTVDKFNILVKLLGANTSYTNGLLHHAFGYGSDVTYKYNLNNEFTYKNRLSETLSYHQCTQCGDYLSEFETKHYNDKTNIKSVDWSTFNDLVADFKDFKRYVNDFIMEFDKKTNRKSVLKHITEDKLPLKMNDKEKLIDSLLDKDHPHHTISDPVDVDTRTEVGDRKTVDREEIEKNINLYTKVDSNLKFGDKICKLEDNSDSSAIDANLDTSDKPKDHNASNNVYSPTFNKLQKKPRKNPISKAEESKSKNECIPTSPRAMINEHPEINILLDDQPSVNIETENDVHKDINRKFKRICILGDYVVERLNMKEFNRHIINNGEVFLKSFSNATIDFLLRYAISTLKSCTTDILVICVGTNNFGDRKKHLKTEIVNGILKIVKMIRDAGVKYILVSSITCRYDLNNEIQAVNSMLKVYAPVWHFTLIDNSNILPEYHLLEDGLRLNDYGITMLANNNYIKEINNILSSVVCWKFRKFKTKDN